MAAKKQARLLEIRLSPETSHWVSEHRQERACIEKFAALMLEELAANDGKGNRPGWLTMDRKTAIGEVHWHAAKLAVAAKEFDADLAGHDDLMVALDNVSRVKEYAADTANCALMVLDCMGLLLPAEETGGIG